MLIKTVRTKLSLVVSLVMAAVLALALAACGNANTEEASVAKIGTLATEDFLPMWLADEQSYFEENGIDVEITIFQSAQELSAALAAKAIDGAMTDIPVAANLTAGGTPMTVSWITLGATPEEGRFGIMVGPNSDITDVKQLAGVPVGVGSGTMLEYIMDELMLDAGIPKDQIKKEELKKLPARFQVVMEGNTAAGVFPGSLLALGESQGAKVIIDDTKGDNLSQSVMGMRSEFVEANPKAMEALKAAWNKAAEEINANPEDYRELMIKNATLPENLQQSYPVPSYPQVTLPTDEQAQKILDWMLELGYLKGEVSYDSKTGALVAQE
ncbi:MAG: ABC transporter substrate-binding protein [Coriobacteriia bacterium]|nr:ABC transporter substrate-binding protein [Coriobacteriia bacterium]